jgi:hypothetical protein
VYEVYGREEEGAAHAYENTCGYNVQYVTLAETGDVPHKGSREGNRYS